MMVTICLKRRSYS